MISVAENLEMEVEFVLECDKLRSLGQKHGFPVVRPRPDSIRSFQKLTLNEQNFVLTSIRNYNEVAGMTDFEIDKDGWSDKKFIWNFLKRFKLRLPDDCMSSIEEDHFVELYDNQGRQIFRPIKFFHITSYDIETFLTISWDRLFSRPDEINEAYRIASIKAFTSNEEKVEFLSHLRDHEVSEVDSEGLYTGLNRPILMGPVFQIGSKIPFGGIHVFKPFNVFSRTRQQPVF